MAPPSIAERAPWPMLCTEQDAGHAECMRLQVQLSIKCAMRAFEPYSKD